MKITSWLGIHNTNPPRSIPDNALADAVDVDIDDAGVLLRRPGYGISVAAVVESSYQTRDGVAYLVGAGRLSRVTDGLEWVDIAACDAREFADDGEYLFTSDGLMVFNNTAVNLKIPPPAPPIVSLAAGNLPAGRYLITATQISPDGLMSGAAAVTTVELHAPGGIVINPVADPGYRAVVWMTEATGDKTGGEVFYSQQDGSILPEIFINASGFPDAVKQLEYFDGRLCAAVPFDGHTAIYFSERNHFHLFNAAENFVVVPGHIQHMKATKDALLVGTAAELYATDLLQLTRLADYGVPAGRSMAVHPDNGQVYIHSNRGVCVAMPFQNLTDKVCFLPPGAHCSTHFVHQRGIQQFIALHDGEVTAFNPFTQT